MITRSLFILNFLITGCAISQVVTDQSGSSNETGDIIGMVYDEGAFFINPHFHLILFNQNERFTKLFKEFSFSFDSIPEGSYTLALIDSVKSEGFVNTDTLYDISIGADSISMVAMSFNNQDDHWQSVKIHRKDRNGTGSIEGRFNIEEYEKITGCKFEPSEGGIHRKPDDGKYAAIYLKEGTFEVKTYTDSLGNFRFNDLPIGHYEIVAEKKSKKDICDKSSSRGYSDYPVHQSYKTIQLLVLPKKTSVVEIKKINPWDIFVEHITYESDKLNPKIIIKWKPQFKN